MPPQRHSSQSAPPFLSGGVDQIMGEALVAFWIVLGFRVNETAPLLTPPLLVALHVVTLVAMVVVRPRGSSGSMRISIAVMLYIGVWLLSSVWAWNFWVWFADARVSITLIIAGMVLASVMEIPRLQRGMVNGVFLSMLITIPSSVSGGVDPDGAWIGAFTHKNLMGGFFAVGLLILVMFERRIWVRIGGVAACLALVVLSQSATALLMVSAAVAATVIMRRVATLPPREAAAYFFSISTLVLMVLTTLALQLSTVVSGLGRDGSLSGRTKIWPAVWDQISERPWIGWGPGLWIRQTADPARYISRNSGAPVAHSHNTLLDVLLFWGVVGLVAFLGIYFGVIRAGWRIARIHPVVATFTLGFVAVMTVQSISEPALTGWVAMLALLHVLGQRILAEHRRREAAELIDSSAVERFVSRATVVKTPYRVPPRA